MNRLKVFLVVFGIIALLVGAGFLVNRYLTKGETQKYETQNSYYWTITKNRTSLKGALPDQLQIFTLDNKMVFDSDTVKPMFEESPKITIAAAETKDGMTFKKTFTYDFAEVNLNINLFNNQKYVDISTEIKYTQDKANQFEGIELALDGLSQTSYFDETYTKQNLTNKKIQISQWSPHILETGSKYKATLTDNTAEVMELQKGLKNTNIKFFSYYGPTREGVFARNYEGADKAEPKIDTNIKRTKGEAVALSQRLFVGQDSLSYLPFRYPYAKDSVVSYVSHADLGTVKDIQNDTINRIKAVFFGASTPESPDWNKKGILSHHLRITFTAFALKDANENITTNGSTLEAPNFLAAVEDLYRRGVDVGAHRLTANGVGDFDKPTARIKQGFQILSQFSPTVWVDHHIRDCKTEPNQETLAGCGGLQGNKLYLMNYLVDGPWQYLWASGQDSQVGGPDYQLSAFDKFQDAARVLYYYQGASEALIPKKLLTFASSYTHSSKELTAPELDQLAEGKGFINIHAYFLDNSDQNDAASLKKTNQGTFWRISNHLEEGLKLLGDYQDEDKVWARDFTTVADYLRAWHNVKILDFTKNSVTIQNQGENAIDGLTLYNPVGKIATAKSGDVYYPYIRDNYVVLSRLAKGETRTVEFGSDENIPQIENFTDKHIEISEASYSKTDNQIKINIASSGKPGQDLVVGETEIKIKLSGSINPKITRDGAAFTDFIIEGRELTITTDTNAHNFVIQL